MLSLHEVKAQAHLNETKAETLNKADWKELINDEKLIYTKEIRGKKTEKNQKEGNEENGSSNKKEKKAALNDSEPFTLSLGPFGQVITITLFVILLIGLLYLLIGSEIFGRKNTSIGSDGSTEMELSLDLDKETDLERRLKEALAINNLKLAIRLYFIMIIRVLDQEKFIRWKKQKTNRDYLIELEGGSYHTVFKQLSKWYDTIWYGEKHYSEDDLRSVIGEFESFQSELKRTF